MTGTEHIASMLVYPPGAPGAVTITKGDFSRLQPGEYLNDTLIEFALKYVLFSSFFLGNSS